MSSDFTELLTEFQQTLIDCQRMCLNGGCECLREHRHLVAKSGHGFITWIDDLHKGLLVKIYISTTVIDHQCVRAEHELAQVLIEHAWACLLSGRDLAKAARELSE